MAVFVLTPPDPPLTGQDCARLDIFPGAATPTVFPARTPFWIGYGFAVEPEARAPAQRELSPETAFELVVDDEPVGLVTDSRIAGGRTVARRSIAAFADGLPAGWHRFEGRWYDAGTLVLTSDTRVQFVEA
jgi:hypothetical protein